MNLLSERLDHIYKLRPDLDGERGQSGLIRASGASKSVVNQWLAGKIKTIDIKFALEIERNLRISHIWLMTGEGDPEDVPFYGAKAREAARLEPPVVKVEPPPNTLQWVSPKEAELLNIFRGSEHIQQTNILAIAATVAAGRAGDQVKREDRAARRNSD